MLPGCVARSSGGRRGSCWFVDDFELDPVRVVEEGRVVPLDVVRELLGSALRLQPPGSAPTPSTGRLRHVTTPRTRRDGRQRRSGRTEQRVHRTASPSARSRCPAPAGTRSSRPAHPRAPTRPSSRAPAAARSRTACCARRRSPPDPRGESRATAPRDATASPAAFKSIFRTLENRPEMRELRPCPKHSSRTSVLGLTPVTQGWFVVSVRDAEWWFSEGEGREVPLRERVRRPAGRVRPVRVQRHRPRAGGDRPLSRRGEPGGVPRPFRRVRAARRGRGATPAALGLLPLFPVDEHAFVGAGEGAVCDPDGRFALGPGSALPGVGARGELRRKRGGGDLRLEAGVRDGRAVPARATAELGSSALGVDSLCETGASWIVPARVQHIPGGQRNRAARRCVRTSRHGSLRPHAGLPADAATLPPADAPTRPLEEIEEAMRNHGHDNFGPPMGPDDYDASHSPRFRGHSCTLAQARLASPPAAAGNHVRESLGAGAETSRQSKRIEATISVMS